MIEVRRLSKSFGKKKVLKDVSFTMENGVYGLLGANGAGKTTLIRSLTLLYPDKQKAILKDGMPISNDKGYLGKVGYLPQQFGLFKELSVFDALSLLASFKGLDAKQSPVEIERCLELVNLSDERDKKVSSLSGGMLRRVGIAQALLGNPQLVIFDEPTAGLDPIERLRFKSIISKTDKKKTIIVSTHIVEDIEAVCDYVIILDSGKMLGVYTCEELKEKADGKVYEIPEEEVVPLNADVFVEKIFERGGHAIKRVLSSKRLNGSQCAPTLEDGYLCVVKGI